jgi:dienelactone hydrolase
VRRAALLGVVTVGMAATAMGVSASPAKTIAPRPLALKERCVTKAERRHVLRFKAIDGVRLIGVEFGRGQRVVVLAHQGGAPPNLCGWVPYARTLAAAGYRVLVFDHRKYGSSGRASHWRRADRVDFDVLGAIRTMRARGASSIVLGGASLGGAAVLAAAPHATPAVDGVISFSSPRNYVNVNVLAGVQASNVPVLFLAEEDDDPFDDDARALFEASPARDKHLEIYPGGEHGFRLLRNPSTRALVNAFLASHSAR